MRTELAQAVGTCRLFLVVNDDLGRGLATALRWLGVDATACANSELEQLETELDLPSGIGERLVQAI